MGVVPVSTGLVQCIKLVQKAFVWFYGALSNTVSAIGPVRLSLVYAMPVLPSIQHPSELTLHGDTDHARCSVHCRVVEPVHHVDSEVIALQKQKESMLGDYEITENTYFLGRNQRSRECSFCKHGSEGR